MPDEKLVNYIEKHLKKGIKPGRIKSALLKAGHDSESIEEAFAHVHSRKNITKVVIVTAVIVVLAVLVLIDSEKPSEKTAEEVIEPEIKETPEEQKFSDDDTTKAETALREQNIALCDEVNDQDLKERCKTVIGRRLNK